MQALFNFFPHRTGRLGCLPQSGVGSSWKLTSVLSHMHRHQFWTICRYCFVNLY